MSRSPSLALSIALVLSLVACGADTTEREPSRGEGESAVAGARRSSVQTPVVSASSTAAPLASRRRSLTSSRFSVSGVVVDGNGEPVRGVVVGLDRTVEPNLEGEERRAALSALSPVARERHLRVPVDASGAYRFSGVEPGYYDLGLAEHLSTGLDAASRGTWLGDDTELDLRLPGELGLGGVVEFPRGETVTLELAQGSRDNDRIHFPLGWNRSIELPGDGRFRFNGLVPGHYRIRATSPGLANASLDLDLRTSTEDARLVLQEGITFAGRIELGFETEFRRVWCSGAAVGEEESRWAGWHDDGVFSASGLTPGEYHIELQGIVRGDKDRRVVRDLVLELREDTLDFHYRLDDDVPVELSVVLPEGTPSTEGTLTATSADGITVQARRIEVAAPHGESEYRVWLSGLYGTRWSHVPQLELPGVSPGTWIVRLELLGHEPWTRIVEVARGLALEATPVRKPGRLLMASYEHTFFRVETRPAGGGPWRLGPWRDDRSVSSHSPTPRADQAWLAEGTYDVRITSDVLCERVLRGVRVSDDLLPLVIDDPLAPGARIAGHVVTRRGTGISTRLVLWRREGEAWVKQATKQHLSGDRFAFRGLMPGRYRATLDEEGCLPVGEWELGEEDLLDQRIVLDRG